MGKYYADWNDISYNRIGRLPYMASREIAEKIISEMTKELDIIRLYR